MKLSEHTCAFRKQMRQLSANRSGSNSDFNTHVDFVLQEKMYFRLPNGELKVIVLAQSLQHLRRNKDENVSMQVRQGLLTKQSIKNYCKSELKHSHTWIHLC